MAAAVAAPQRRLSLLTAASCLKLAVEDTRVSSCSCSAVAAAATLQTASASAAVVAAATAAWRCRETQNQTHGTACDTSYAVDALG